MGQLLDVGKESYIEGKGYQWVPEFDAYINHAQWKIFTRNYLDDHSFETILRRLADQPTNGQWKIYTNTEAEEDIHNIHRHYGAQA